MQRCRKMLSPFSHTSTKQPNVFLLSPACVRDFFLPYVLRHLDRPSEAFLFVMMVLLARL